MGKRRTLRMTIDTKIDAKLITLYCFRNTIIERFHRQGQLSQDDMKAFNKEVLNRIYTFLDCTRNRSKREKDLFLGRLTAELDGYTAGWDEPEFDENLWSGEKNCRELIRRNEQAKKALAARQALGQPLSSTAPRRPPSTRSRGPIP